MTRLLTGAILLLALPPQFRSQVDLVEVYVTVSAARVGRPAPVLGPDDFEVLEDGRPRRVEVFAAGEFPLAVALATDRSFSMAGTPLAMARSAGHVFLGALRPADRAAIVAIGSQVEALGPLGADRAAQHAALQAVTAWGTTSLHDAILASIDAIQPAGGRRALVLLSDGDDRYSEHSAEAVLARAREADVLIYPIALGEPMPALFGHLAELTGGRAFHVRQTRALAPTLEAIAAELRGQYLLGYIPAPVAPGAARAWRSIEVRVKAEGLVVRARRGYFAGEEIR